MIWVFACRDIQIVNSETYFNVPFFLVFQIKNLIQGSLIIYYAQEELNLTSQRKDLSIELK